MVKSLITTEQIFLICYKSISKVYVLHLIDENAASRIINSTGFFARALQQKRIRSP